MTDWKPIRKIIAALAAALVGNGGALSLYLAGTIDGRTAIAAGLSAIVPALAGYFAPDVSAKLEGGYTPDPDPGEPEGDA